MELLMKTSEPLIPRKRLLDNANDCHLVELKKLKTYVQDFPPGCGIEGAERKILKNLETVDSDSGKMTSHSTDKLVGSELVENNTTNNFKSKEYMRKKSSFGLRATSKVKFWDPRTSKEGLQRKPKVTTTITRRKPLKNVDNVDLNLGKMASHGKDKLVESHPLEHNECKSFKAEDLGRNNVQNHKPSSVGEMARNKASNCLKNVDAQKQKGSIGAESRKEQVRRDRIKEAMKLFYQIKEQLYQDNRLRPKGEKISHWRVTMDAARMVKQKLKLMDPEKTLGPICGVRIGDKFRYRSQLRMIGLHCQPQSGIDYTKIKGKNVAISIVDSHRYSNESRFSEMLIYCGQGGNRGIGFLGGKLPPEDQKLQRGNMALKNSIEEKTPVRVIRKIEGVGKKAWFVYDGLYVVIKFTEKRSEEGKILFKFRLNRLPGQPPLKKMLRASS